ncbi:hypothetical protein, partial [Rhizobium sp. BK275]|uniref:hypothetical protein n=1 Tax=Rhizobium sp. BK275 TaxID=2587077 RepID=UPI001AED9A1A
PSRVQNAAKRLKQSRINVMRLVQIFKPDSSGTSPRMTPSEWQALTKSLRLLTVLRHPRACPEDLRRSWGLTPVTQDRSVFQTQHHGALLLESLLPLHDEQADSKSRQAGRINRARSGGFYSLQVLFEYFLKN